MARRRSAISHSDRTWVAAIEPGKPFEKKPEYAWFDSSTPADVGGFTTDSFIHFTAMMLRRWWRENWFQPIARVGNIGNYEYPLHPAAPLPKVDFSACKAISQSASPDDRVAEVDCETKCNIRRNEMLISDITPGSTGQFYIYVNDAILFWPCSQDTFYRNNSGKAKVTVTRTVAPATVDFKPPEGGQPTQKN